MNRRLFLTGAALLSVGSLTACTSSETAMPAPAELSATPSTTPDRRVLLAYFSRPGENYSYGGRTTLDVGNTQIVADMIAAASTVDVYRIEAADPYPDDYDATVARNVQEENVNARPAIANPLPDVAGYDTVLLGCPVWNVQTPMILRTFVDSVDLAGKRLHPFVTYAVSGIGRVEDDYAALCPDANLGESLAVQGEKAADARADVDAWLRRIGL
ncbi:Flavodoxin [Plantibacter flavus]|uniref:Flavodoxin n=2 Tax=Plantibacter flavus TaxID=150123 RepID=A0A3N2C6C2_9MICO|nr:flavodoxin [Plantibacter flavus]SMG46653.1 Flavodoxin [Plantibacter flavus]